MWIKRVITVNWGGLPNREYDFGSVVMLGGSTGSGKSTLEDAIQVVMTAGKHGFYKFNAGQDESGANNRGKIPRTVPSYVLGAEGNKFARPHGANGYIAVVFANSPGESSRVFSAVLAFQASLNEHGSVGKGGRGSRRAPVMREEKLFTIAEGEVRLSDFGEPSKVGLRSVMPVDQIFNRLRRPDRGLGKVTEHKGKQAYLNSLWGLMRNTGPVPPDEARKACLSFRGAMAYRPVSKLDQFVKEDILEVRDHEADIDNLSQSIRSLYQLRAQAERLEENVKRLEAIDSSGVKLVDNWQGVVEQAYLESARMVFDLDVQRSRAMKDKAEKVERKKGLAREISDIDGKLKSIRAQIGSLSRELDGNAAAQERERLDRLITDAASRFTANGRELFESISQIRESLRSLQAIGQVSQQMRTHDTLAPGFAAYRDAEGMLQAFDADSLHRSLVAMSKCSPLDDAIDEPLKAVTAESGDVDAAVGLARDVLYEPEKGLRSLVAEVLSDARRRENSLRDEVLRIRGEIQRLADAREISYPREIPAALAQIDRELPSAKPRVLCNLVEVVPADVDWQNAIEGLIGYNRYVIIVEPEYEPQANRLLATAGSRAKIVQAFRLLKLPNKPLPSNSIVQSLRISDKVAKAYVHAKYGDVVRVSSFEELRDTTRGLMKEGRGASGFATFRAFEGDSKLVFGESGREKRLAALQAELTEKNVTFATAETWRGSLASLSRLIDAAEKTALTNRLDLMVEERRSIVDARRQQAEIDLSGIEDLIAEKERLYEEQVALGTRRDACLGLEGSLRAEIQSLSQEVEELDERLDSAERSVTARRDYVDKLSDSVRYAASERIQKLNHEAQSPIHTLDKISAERKSRQRSVDEALNLFRNSVMEYNHEATGEEQIKLQETLHVGRIDFDRDDAWANYYAFREGLSQVRRQLGIQRDNALASMKQKLLAHEAEVSHTFSQSFCQIVHNDLAESQEQLDTLNGVLGGHTFNEDSYEFKRFAVSEHEARSRFFKYVATEVQLLSGQRLDDSGVLDDAQLEIYRQIRQKLERSNEDEARKTLMEWSDYRNYHTYDVLVTRGEDNQFYLGELATDSGGQTETPFYALRSAALSSAYRINEPGSHHFRVMVVDEAFEKVDHSRAAEALDLLSKTLGFQVVMAMPSKNAGSFQPLISTKFVFTKVPSPVKVGELSHKTIVKGEKVNQDPVEKLWEGHVEQVKQQAKLDFEEIEAATLADDTEKREGVPA